MSGFRVKRLREIDGAEEAIRQRYRTGATIGGTSAGAAVMSDVMIAGDDIPLDRGLTLWPEAIVDQHFVVRKRMQRSFDTVLDARNAQPATNGKKKQKSWRDVRIHSLREGMTWQP